LRIQVLSHELKRLRGENKGKDEGQASDLSSVRSAPSKMLFCCLESGSIGIDRDRLKRKESDHNPLRKPDHKYHSKTSLKM